MPYFADDAAFAAAMVNAMGADLWLRCTDDNHDGTADSAVVTDLHRDVVATINGYVGRIYTVSAVEADPPNIVIKIAKDLGMHAAYCRRPEFFSPEGNTPAQGRYREAVKMLTDIGKGDFRLDVNGDPEKPSNVDGAGVRSGTRLNVPVRPGYFKEGFGDF